MKYKSFILIILVEIQEMMKFKNFCLDMEKLLSLKWSMTNKQNHIKDMDL